METYAVNAFTLKPVLSIIIFVPILPFTILFAALFFSTGSVHWKLPLIISGLTLPLTILLLVQLFIAKVSLDDRYLIVGGGLYKEKVSLSEIRREAIAKIDISKNSGVLGTRTNGVGLPGFSFGWFQPYAGKKLFALVSDDHAVLVPTTKPYDLLISPNNVDQFISALRSSN